MNERIRELAEQAGGNPNYKAFRGYFLPPPPDYIDPATVNLEKFAELIVRECVQIALDERVEEKEIDKEDDVEDRCYLRGNNGGIVDAVVAIKKHFGVSE